MIFNMLGLVIPFSAVFELGLRSPGEMNGRFGRSRVEIDAVG